MFDFTNKVILVSGGSRGIGKAICTEFAGHGATVILNYKKNKEKAEEIVNLIKSSGGYATSIKGDVSSFTQCKDMMAFVIENFGKVDVLVNNAGISMVDVFAYCKEENIEEIMGTNLLGTINLTRCALPSMIDRKSGNIINISSMWGQCGASCEVLYSATKGGIDSFTKALGKEMAPSGIRVNAISPGAVATEMNEWMSQKELESLCEDIPLGRLAKPEEIAKLAVFLASDASSYITSQIIRADGGMI
ncbi:3-oxoacyl-[acyl-carrier protein] reductase [Hathewaya proteolytica DSM 3090]|uniref:3-oxoacyl-[acyl-carrier protein] reductase n=1 Tax=Hathewaya proteolytica DSM 3090 TaxID=1121331 RepID=A0A1M6Q3U3_9CLOT|nr:SDR family oxidoreductase [Hathewaya proteolytica]SHK14808.1 3-oxoacyl-[acyl-carrier protein] reductase [Hathewaya proteolytica DSM 3090]